jgi:hypothetical protein
MVVLHFAYRISAHRKNVATSSIRIMLGRIFSPKKTRHKKQEVFSTFITHKRTRTVYICTKRTIALYCDATAFKKALKLKYMMWQKKTVGGPHFTRQNIVHLTFDVLDRQGAFVQGEF